MDEPYALIPNVLLSFFQQHMFSLVTSRSHGFIYDKKNPSPLYVPPLSLIQSSTINGRLEKSAERADSNTEG